MQCNLVKVVCGGAHTSVLSEDGRLFSFGWNDYYQCGIDSVVLNSKSNIDIYVPKRSTFRRSIHFWCKLWIRAHCSYWYVGEFVRLGFQWGRSTCGLGHEQLEWKNQPKSCSSMSLIIATQSLHQLEKRILHVSNQYAHHMNSWIDFHIL